MTIMPHNPFGWLFRKHSSIATPSNKQNNIKPTTLSDPGSLTTNNENPCCGNMIHIAYRGVSDDRLYLSYDRKWQELKYFRPKSLRAYCKECRSRIF
jgi:hypothetical protein